MGGILSASATMADGISWHSVTWALSSSPAVWIVLKSGLTAVGFHGPSKLPLCSPKGAGWPLLLEGVDLDC